MPSLPLVAADSSEADEAGARNENCEGSNGIEGVCDRGGLGDAFEGGELGRKREEEG